MSRSVSLMGTRACPPPCRLATDGRVRDAPGAWHFRSARHLAHHRVFRPDQARGVYPLPALPASLAPSASTRAMRRISSTSCPVSMTPSMAVAEYHQTPPANQDRASHSAPDRSPYLHSSSSSIRGVSRESSSFGTVSITRFLFGPTPVQRPRAAASQLLSMSPSPDFVPATS
jgi:hypothetical protein